MKTLSAAALAAIFAAASVSVAPVGWPAWVERLGWTLVHSAWQLAAVALLTALANRAVRRRSANVRYVTAVAALGIMLLLPGLTWLCLPGAPANGPPDRAMETSEMRPTVAFDASREIATDVRSNAAQNSPPRAPTPARDKLPTAAAPAVAVTAPKYPQPPAQAVERQNDAWRTMQRRLHAAIEPRLPWLVCFWLAGAGLCALRPICGVWAQWRLRRYGLSPAPQTVVQTLSELSRKMRISRAVRIAQSTLVRVPVVVGYFRPLILLPASVVTGMTPRQLEAVLAHELAHVRRHDWLVNALQVLAETVLFYHPAVWWISRRLRCERELCCDDVAIELIDDRAVFARALLLAEELRQMASAPPAVTLAATGGQLSHRIRRLLGDGAAPQRTTRGWLSGAVLLLTLGLAGGVSLFAAPQPDGPQQATAPAEKTLKKPKRAEGANASEPADSGNKASTGGDSAQRQQETDSPQRIVAVVDEKNQPVAGATVRFQFRSATRNRAFALDPVKTDARGEARVEIPESSERVFLSVTADGFGESTANESASGKSTITLKRGHVIRVRAVDADGRVLKDAVPLLADSRVWGREFKLHADGVYQSPPVALTRKLLRVACAPEQGPMLFSELIDISTAKPGNDGVYELTLRPGVRLEGRLDDSVPRPIGEGYVELAIVEGEQGKLSVGGWNWSDFTPVRPDGSFTFESLPGGGHAQLHVLVDGYISKNPTLEELLEYVRKHELADEEQMAEVSQYVEHRAMWPRFAPLDQPQATVTIPCEPTAACDFRLLDPSGKAVADADVRFNPNGVFLYGGLFIPGTESSQTLLVDGLRRGKLTWPFGAVEDGSPHSQEAQRRNEWATRSFMSAKSDAEGRVRVRNLPGGVRESFQVSAQGFVLPVSPLLDDEDLARRNAADDNDRYGLVELVSGETIAKTIYLERVQPTVDRELIVIDAKGRPLPGVSLAVAEMRVGEKDWQTWSTQRFGRQPRGSTDSLGRLVLRLPSVVDAAPVQSVRLGVNYSSIRMEPVEQRLFISRRVVEVSLAPDGGVIMLLADPDRPNREFAAYPGIARYGRLEDIMPNASPADWLAMMIEQPNLAVLRKLLAGAKIKYPEPVELLATNRRASDEQKIEVHTPSDGEKKYAVVEARVRPLSGLRAQESDFQRLPECAYVFDMQGNLLAALGGEIGPTGSGSPDDVDLVNLGPGEDWFVRVMRFERKGPFEFVTTFYRLATPIIHSLRYLHYANSNAWSHGSKEIRRFGTLYFSFPQIKDKLGFKALGTTADGVTVIPEMIWDGDRNRFVGAAWQQARNQPLYEVDATWSQDFDALSPKADQLVIDGGERDFDHWHSWEMAVPQGCHAMLTLSLPQPQGPPRIVERMLQPGRQLVQLQLKPLAEGAAAKLRLGVDDTQHPGGQEKLDFELSLPLGDRPQKRPPIFHTLDLQQTARVLTRPLKTGSQSVTLDIKLLAP